MLMTSMAFPNLVQTIPHQKLIVPRRENRRGDINKNTDPGVAVVEGEGLAPEEDGGHYARAEVTGEVRGDGVDGEAPDHGRVGEADGEGDGDGGDERVGRVQARPDDDADEAVDEELLEEQEALVRLVGVRKHAEDGGGPAVEHGRAFFGDGGGFEGLDFGPVRPHKDQSRHERAEYLAEYVMRDFPPREARPDGEANGDSGVEMPAGYGSAGDDGEGDTDSETKADLEDVAVERDGECACRVHGEGCNSSDPGEDVEEDACCFGHHLAENTRTCVLEVELALANWWGWDDMTGDMPFESFRGANFDVMSMEAMEITVGIPVRHGV